MSDHPYPGLRPFHRDETDIFFGRERQTDDLVGTLERTRFLAVLGQSGSGKSSLVLTGLLPALEGGFMGSARPLWSIAQMRPGNMPFARLAEALLDDPIFRKAYSGGGEPNPHAVEFLEAALERGPLAIEEILELTPLPGDAQLLIIVDQFEELFRYQEEGNEEAAANFVALLLHAHRYENVYVAITMRSDFLGDCSIFQGLPEAINRGLFLTPKLTRGEMAEAIRLPARIFGGQVEDALVNHLLNETAGEVDQLPLLQHALRRTWDIDDDKILTLPEYEALGGLERVLSDHADEAYNALDKKEKRIAEIMFRCLTERASDLRDTRRPTKVEEVAAVAGVKPEKLYKVVDRFRQPDRCFLMPPANVKLTPKTVLDISHESLIRQWSRLRQWTIDEAERGETYRRVIGAARRCEAGRGELWRGVDLQAALDWRDNEDPRAEWAERYGGDLELALEFLKQSEAEEIRHKRDKMRAQEREIENLKQVAKLTRIRVLTLRIATAFFGIATVVLLVYLRWYVWDHSAYYDGFNKAWGVPFGVGELSPEQQQRRAVTLRLTRAGTKNPVHMIEAVDSFGNCTTQHNIGTYFEYPDDIDEEKKPCRWDFVIDAKGNVNYEVAYDKNDNQLWVFDYSAIAPQYTDDSGRPTVRQARMIDRENYKIGRNMRGVTQGDFVANEQRTQSDVAESNLRGMQAQAAPGQSAKESETRSTPDTGQSASQAPQPGESSTERRTLGYMADSVEFHYDEFGHERHLVFLNSIGELARGPDRQFVQRRHHEDGRVVTIESLDRHENLMNDIVGNAILHIRYNEMGFQAEYEALDKDRNRVMTVSGWSRVTYEYDDSGNVTDMRLYDTEDAAFQGTDGYHHVRMTYDDRGNIIKEQYFDGKGDPTPSSIGVYAVRYEYEDNSHRLAGSYFLDADMNPMIGTGGYAAYKQKYDPETGQVVEATYHDEEGNLSPAVNYAIVRYEYNAQGQREYTKYYGADERPVDLFGGHSQVVSQYDDRSSSTRYINAAGLPGTDYDGISTYLRQFDLRGNEIEVEYLGPDGERVPNWNGVSIIRRSFDIYNNPKSESYFDEFDERVMSSEGYARVEREFNERGKILQETYFDEQGRPGLESKNYAMVRHEYDDDGNQIVTTYHDATGELVETSDGYMSWSRRYDDMGNVTESRFLDLQGEAVVNFLGYAYKKTEWNSHGNVTRETFFDNNDEPYVLDGYATVTSEYDAYGRLTANYYFDENGQPAINTDTGHHGFIMEYDDLGRVTAELTIGVDGNYMDVEEGSAIVRREYDNAGNITRESYFNADGTAAYRDGYAAWTAEYDDFAEIVEIYYFDGDGAPANSESAGYHGYVIEKDELGRKIREYALDVDGRYTEDPQGLAILTTAYDEWGNAVDMAAYDAEEKLVLSDYGYARITRKYDENGNMVEEAYFDDSNEPAIPPTIGCARVAWGFDERGDPTEERCVDSAGAPAVYAMTDGVVLIRREFNERGDFTSESYFDASDTPIQMLESVDSPHRSLYERGIYGEFLREQYFDTDGNPVPWYSSVEEALNEACTDWHYTYDRWGDHESTRCAD